MELRKNNLFTHQLKEISHRFLSPFLFNEAENNKLTPFIMPLKQVEQILTDHYVSQVPLSITFEYYDSEDKAQQKTIEGCVLCPIRLDRRILLNDLAHDFTFIIPVDHILRVSQL